VRLLRGGAGGAALPHGRDAALRGLQPPRSRRQRAPHNHVRCSARCARPPHAWWPGQASRRTYAWTATMGARARPRCPWRVSWAWRRRRHRPRCRRTGSPWHCVELPLLRAWDYTHGWCSTKSVARHEGLPVLLRGEKRPDSTSIQIAHVYYSLHIPMVTKKSHVPCACRFQEVVLGRKEPHRTALERAHLGRVVPVSPSPSPSSNTVRGGEKQKVHPVRYGGAGDLGVRGEQADCAPT
jgi:hypothetical protein